MCIFCERAQSQMAGEPTLAEKREAERCERLRERRVRATILTGFLGAGKTTFLNFVLKSAHGRKLAVVQNEFGSVSVDDKLMAVEQSSTEVITMPNGCLCCRVRGDLVDALRRLAERGLGGTGEGEPPLDGLIIECSGLSEVTPVAQTFFADPFVQGAYTLDGVVCVCDAGSFQAMEAGGSGEDVARLLREQLAIADVALLNKCDLVSSQQREAIVGSIRALKPSARVVPCRQGKVNLGQVMQLNSFSLDSVISIDEHFLQPTHGHGIGGSHVHELFGSLGVEVADAIDLQAFKTWMMRLVETRSEALIRMKGILRVAGDDGKRVIVQGVGGHVEVGEAETAPTQTTCSRMVFIGRLDDALRKELRRGFASTVQSLAGDAP